MALTIGARFGSYDIVAPLGVGGMGEVYRARFEREARVLATLNHPHIAAIYGLEDVEGVSGLVLQLVEGETLAERVARSGLPIDEVLAIARQIADGLDAAYESGSRRSRATAAPGRSRRSRRRWSSAARLKASSARKVVFTSVGEPGGDGAWIADLDRRATPRQLTRAGEFRAFFGAPGEIVYMNQGKIRYLFRWSLDGKSLSVALQYYGVRTQRTVVLPYRSDVPLEQLWPKGLKTEADVLKNPGAKVFNEADLFPASTASTYLVWRRATQSNLYRIPIPN